jgi:asparagine synthase (glutamine-hydrolysing)
VYKVLWDINRILTLDFTMCGILGSTIVHHNTIGFENATRMLAHRGPDFTGVYRDSDIQIHHLLLAIRGTTDESKQPVHKSGSPWVLAFNGQLYNTKAIRTKIQNPVSEVDTVLLYQLIEKYGWDFIHHIHGMFAIVLYNKEERKVRLYRDSAGQKCLYYRVDREGISFASEIKGLLALTPEGKVLDPLSLKLALSIGYIPGNRTLVKDVFKIMPSEVVTYDIPKKELSKNIFNAQDQEYYAGVSPEIIMQNVVEEHLQSKYDLSINLSGGLDSSLLFHEAVRSGRTVSAFSTRFDIESGTYNRDADLAEQLAKDYRQTFTKITITKQSYLEHFIESYTAIEEPNFNISIPIYFETARTEGINGKGLRVVLSGDGGDELFGGYPHYAEVKRIAQLQSDYTRLGINLYKWLRNGYYIDYPLPIDTFYALRGFRKDWEGNHMDRKSTLSYLHTITDESMTLYGEKPDPVSQLMLFDRFVWLASENFIRSDKLYMHESMEMRCPLAYQPLRTYMDMNISASQYIDSRTNKIFLRNLYKEKLPSYITLRKDKTGWRAPVAVWYDKEYKRFFLDIISSMEDTNTLINWNTIKKVIESSDVWPGKTAHLYLSLALIIKKLELHA